MIQGFKADFYLISFLEKIIYSSQCQHRWYPSAWHLLVSLRVRSWGASNGGCAELGNFPVSSMLVKAISVFGLQGRLCPLGLPVPGTSLGFIYSSITSTCPILQTMLPWNR